VVGPPGWAELLTEWLIVLVREKLSLDRDHEIATTSICVSLICPVCLLSPLQPLLYYDRLVIVLLVCGQLVPKPNPGPIPNSYPGPDLNTNTKANPELNHNVLT